MKKKIAEKDPLLGIIIESALDKKAKDLVELNLIKVEEAPVDHFVICHGDSSTQVNAIADNIIDEVKKATGTIPYSKEGMRNAEWVLIDYGYIVVHVFFREKRYYYQLEELWNDAIVTEYDEKEIKKPIKQKTKNVRTGK